MSEKRKEHRLRANIPVILSWGKEKGLQGRTENISRLGAFVELNKQVPAGATVGITLAIPAYTQDISLAGNASCSGTVFRSSPLGEIDGAPLYGVGVFFTDFAGPRDKDKISAFVDHLIREEERGIREGLRRRKEKETVHLAARRKESAAARQEDFQKEALTLLKEIARRLDDLGRTFNARKK